MMLSPQRNNKYYYMKCIIVVAIFFVLNWYIIYNNIIYDETVRRSTTSTSTRSVGNSTLQLATPSLGSRSQSYWLSPFLSSLSFLRLPDWITASSNDGISTRQNMNMVCQKIEGNEVEGSSSFRQIWQDHIKEKILNVSLLQADWSHDLRSHPEFVQWVQESMEYFTYDRLQHSSLSQPIDQTLLFRRIYTIMEQKILQPNTSPSLHILVFGGSVTVGMCCFDNIFDFIIKNNTQDNTRKSSTEEERKVCAWPGRLQDMMDAIFGSGVVVITNMAIGGVQTDISTSVLEFGLLPAGYSPDIIIWDHSTNDALSPIEYNGINNSIDPEWIRTDTEFKKLQAFYQAMINLPLNDPPVLLLLDSFLGQWSKMPIVSESLATSFAISKMMQWYPDIWGISYASIVRPYVYSHLNDYYASIPLLGTKGLVTHHGMMYHISMAWTISFNLLKVLHDNCNAENIVEQQQEQMTQRPQEAEVDPSERIVPDMRMQPQQVSQDPQNVMYIPELTNKLLVYDISSEWEKRVSLRKTRSTEASVSIQRQQKKEVKTTGKMLEHSSLKCYYAWMVNRVLQIQNPYQIDSRITPYMINNSGWTSNHVDSRQSPGWVAESGFGAIFTLQFEDVPYTVESLTILYMLSYSEKWYNSTLQIDATFEDTAVTTIDGDTNTTTTSTVQHIISGYHDNESSIVVPITLSLYNDTQTFTTLTDMASTNITMNRLLRLQFELIGGETFKIAGLAIC